MVRRGRHLSSGQVARIKGLDVYAMMGGKVVGHALSLETLGITSNCTVSFFLRLRGGSRERICLGSGRARIASRSVAGR